MEGARREGRRERQEGEMGNGGEETAEGELLPHKIPSERLNLEDICLSVVLALNQYDLETKEEKPVSQGS